MASQYRPPMPEALADRLRARGAIPPSYDGRGLLNLPATVLETFGARTADDPPPLSDLDPSLLDGVRQIVVVLADGLGWWQLEHFCAQGVTPFLTEPEIFRNEPMKRMHAAEATYVGYVLPTTMGVRLRELVTARPHGTAPSYVYAYWSGIDTSSHLHGPRSAEAASEAASFDL